MRELTARDRIVKAKLELKHRAEFFFGLALYLNPVEGETNTMGVDDKDNLYYNPDFVNSLVDTDLQAILVHEIMHLVYGHTKEYESNKDLDNIAKDIKVNNTIFDEGFSLKDQDLNWMNIKNNQANFKLTDKNKRIHDIQITNIKEKTWHQIYNQIKHIDLDKDSDKNNKNTDDHGKWDDQNSKGDQAEQAKDTRKWASRAQIAAMKTKGNLSAELKRLLDKISAPEIQWNEILRDKVEGTMITDYTWSKPSKLYYSLGIYLPGYKKEDFSMLAHIDTSGSITEQELDKALSELYGIYDSNPGCTMDILVGDAELKQHLSVTSSNRDQLKSRLKGGGGTSHAFVFEWIENNNWNGNVIVSFTDGYSDIPRCVDKYKPNADLIFIGKEMCSSVEPYGQVIKIGE